MTSIPITPYNRIVNQQFNDAEIILKNADFAGVQYKDNTINVVFESCAFRNLNIQNKEFIKFKEVSIGFFECYIERIEVDEILAENISINFLNTIVAGRIESNNLASVSTDNCFTHGLFLMNQKSINISYDEEIIFVRRWIPFMRKLGIKDYKKLLSSKIWYHLHDYGKLDIRGKENKTKKQGFYISQTETHPGRKLKYYLTEEDKLLLNINLSIHFSETNADVNTLILDMKLRSISIKGPSNGKVCVEKCKINHLFIRDFLIKREAIFYSISPGNTVIDASTGNPDISKVEIHKCNLENVLFDNFHFDQYQIISFYRTKFSKAVFSSCNFPSDYKKFEKFQSLQNIHYPENKKDNFHKDQYEIFLQLRKSLESSGNFFEANKLHAVSNDALREIKDISFSDKFILWLNKFSNNHGISIKQAFWGFLLISIVLYLSYLGSLGRICNGNDFDPSLIGYYFAFLDITHRNDFLVDKEHFGFWTLAIDYISKLIIGFYIYQFISAFRKYGKK